MKIARDLDDFKQSACGEKKQDVNHVYCCVIQLLASISLEIFFTAVPEVKEGTQ